MFAVIAIITFSLLLVASLQDLRTREIPDWISVLIGTIAIVSSLLGWLGLSIAWVLVGGLTGLLIAYALFHFAKLGGGDGKLIVSLGLLVGPVGLLIVLFWMAMAGGVLSLIAMLRGQRDYAYVPAILFGFIGYIAFVSFYC
ncbi:A24 family peptidase [Rhodopirellula halodulae]|uniref:A24 family peptidase n=1 Tax=Rhodopirellula halodulae TaxID=2894198 RepID=UPI001E288A9B|nr:prepilin peptidase [Rhodopirellula sp. JC737]MCC9655013.1 prepilin peptidase [Rhodopirellula sp. JC737]